MEQREYYFFGSNYILLTATNYIYSIHAPTTYLQNSKSKTLIVTSYISLYEHLIMLMMIDRHILLEVGKSTPEKNPTPKIFNSLEKE